MKPAQQHSLPPLLTSSELAQLREQAKLLPDLMHSGHNRRAGPHLAFERGAGLELEELRRYQHGDEVRHMAWRATARRGTAMMKVFRAERQSRRLLIIDRHPGMYFGSHGELKATTATRIAALLAFNALDHQTELSAIIHGHERRYFDSSNRLDDALAILRHLSHAPAQSMNGIDAAIEFPAEALLNQLLTLNTRRSQICFISDFTHWQTNSCTPLLKQLAQQHQLLAFQVSDKGEQQLPSAGKLRLFGVGLIDSDNAQLQQRYQSVMQEKQESISQMLQQSAIPHLRIDTALENKLVSEIASQINAIARG